MFQGLESVHVLDIKSQSSHGRLDHIYTLEDPQGILQLDKLSCLSEHD